MKTKYMTSIGTDTGLIREKNQDSVCVKVAKSKAGDMMMAVICDGMGGLEKGELASADVLQSFEQWFIDSLPQVLDAFTLEQVAMDWKEMIDHENTKIRNYGLENESEMGTTLTAMFFWRDEYLIAHVGDSRAYRLGNRCNMLTKDHTIVEKEVESGILTKAEAASDRRKHILWQCIGASVSCKPDFVHGRVKNDEVFLLCTDGFYHTIDESEVCEIFASHRLTNEKVMKRRIKEMIELAIKRGEEDNISVILIKVSSGKGECI